MTRRALLLVPLALLAVPLAPVVHATPPHVMLPLEPLLEGVPSLSEWVRVTLREEEDAPYVRMEELTLRTPPGIEIEGDATRALSGEPGAREASWRVRVVEPGLWRISADAGSMSWCCVYVATDAEHAAWAQDASTVLPSPGPAQITAQRVGNDSIRTSIVVPPVQGVLAEQRVGVTASVLGWPQTTATVLGRDGATFSRLGAFDPSRCHHVTVQVQPQPVFRGATGDEQLYLGGNFFEQSFTAGPPCREGKTAWTGSLLGPPVAEEETPPRRPVPATPLVAMLALCLAALALASRRE